MRSTLFIAFAILISSDALAGKEDLSPCTVCLEKPHNADNPAKDKVCDDCLFAYFKRQIEAGSYEIRVIDHERRGTKAHDNAHFYKTRDIVRFLRERNEAGLIERFEKNQGEQISRKAHLKNGEHPCPNGNCDYWASKKSKAKKCPQCATPLNVPPTKELIQQGRECPECKERLEKISGCDAATCTECQTPFRWDQARFVAECVRQDMGDEACSICREKLKTDANGENDDGPNCAGSNEIAVMPCRGKHRYHKACLKEITYPRCPACWQEVDGNAPVTIYPNNIDLEGGVGREEQFANIVPHLYAARNPIQVEQELAPALLQAAAIVHFRDYRGLVGLVFITAFRPLMSLALASLGVSYFIIDRSIAADCDAAGVPWDPTFGRFSLWIAASNTAVVIAELADLIYLMRSTRNNPGGRNILPFVKHGWYWSALGTPMWAIELGGIAFSPDNEVAKSIQNETLSDSTRNDIQSLRGLFFSIAAVSGLKWLILFCHSIGPFKFDQR